MPGLTILKIPEDEQEQMLTEVRRARYGYWLALHILLLCARGYSPTEIAEVLFCSRSSVYRVVKSYRAGSLQTMAEAEGLSHFPRLLTPSLRRSLLALLNKAPSTLGWCRTRWSCATLAAQLHLQRGVQVSAATLRPWLHQMGYVWKRAQLVGRDDDPERAAKLAAIRYFLENLGNRAALLFADELDIHLLPKVGYQWMRVAERLKLVTPGVNQKRYLAGALDHLTGQVIQCVGGRKTAGLFLELLQAIEHGYPMTAYREVFVVLDNFSIHKAKVVRHWLEQHPRIKLIFLPTYCPQGNPIERLFWEVHDKCTRNHRRRKIEQVVGDVKTYLQEEGPWRYNVSQIYYEEEVTAEVKKLEKYKLAEAA